MEIEFMTISEMAEKKANEIMNEFLESDEFKTAKGNDAVMMHELADVLRECTKCTFKAGASWALLVVTKLIYEQDKNKSFGVRFHEAIERITVGSEERRNKNVKRKRKEEK